MKKKVYFLLFLITISLIFSTLHSYAGNRCQTLIEQFIHSEIERLSWVNTGSTSKIRARATYIAAYNNYRAYKTRRDHLETATKEAWVDQVTTASSLSYLQDPENNSKLTQQQNQQLKVLQSKVQEDLNKIKDIYKFIEAELSDSRLIGDLAYSIVQVTDHFSTLTIDSEVRECLKDFIDFESYAEEIAKRVESARKTSPSNWHEAIDMKLEEQKAIDQAYHKEQYYHTSNALFELISNREKRLAQINDTREKAAQWNDAIHTALHPEPPISTSKYSSKSSGPSTP